MKYREAEINKLIQRTLFCGVVVSAALLAAGSFFAVGLNIGGGRRFIEGGLLGLLMTPGKRVMMLAFGYFKAGRPRLAFFAIAVLLSMTGGFFIG